eukprot:CAMPEP_0194169748 /NCGR_PEP_ID=MMETSP0154-20130528/4418_1 /TAXON_ID=1049557 /ORGANISM="Thalassiothrix antarctica, Strain L6-D1" /LENGTH=611 /DNA_ID=CAMNT_0038881287 /DNA_START=61 /DNA_END=1893 /DNA_ORIENTATION=-
MLVDELKTAFSTVGLKNIPDEILSKCFALSTSQGITPKQLANVWDAYSMNRKVTDLTKDCFEGYRKQVLKDFGDNEDSVVISRLPQKRANNDIATVTPNKKRLVTDDEGPLDRSIPNSVSSSISPKKVLMPAVYKSYDDREGVGKIVASYRPKEKKLPDSLERSDESQRCTISTDFDTNVTKVYRHMNFPLDERANILEEHLVKTGEAIFSQYKGDAEIEAVGVPRQDKVICIGRICNEAHEGRVNPTTLMLEGSKYSSNGARVHLDVSDMSKPYSLFPGQIVAVEGINATGRKFVVDTIYDKVVTPELKLEDGEKKALQIMTVSGPFTTSNNLEYAPIRDFLQIVCSSKPDVVILAGPFVDIEQTEDMGPELEVEGQPVTYEILFAQRIAMLLEELYEEENDFRTQFVLVPSLRDAVAEWVLPQAPFSNSRNDAKFLKLKGAEDLEFGTLGLEHIEAVGEKKAGQKRIHCFSNPCTFRINDITIGITSHDVLMDLSREEMNRNLAPGTRLVRIAEHLLHQCCYYPLFPASNVNIDLKHFDKMRMPCQPDVLIIPSKLAPMAKCSKGDTSTTMIINPGHLTKGTTGGTYAVMDIHKRKDNDSLSDSITINV